MNRPKLTSYESALQQVLIQASRAKTEKIKAFESLGRVLSEDITSDRAYPPFNRSAMDGFAIRKEDFDKGTSVYNIEGTLFAGDKKAFKSNKNDCIRIMTGAAVPKGYDCVVRIEDCEFTDTTLTLSKTLKLKSWNNIAIQGEDLVEGQQVISKGTKIDHSVYGLLATLGKAEIAVFKQPKVAIIATGNELKKIDEAVEENQIRESNSYVLTGLLKQLDIEPSYRGIVVDDKKAMMETIGQVSAYDIVILTGGVSMGEADFTPEILAAIGVEKVFHKVAIKPGKPIWFGKKANGVVFALPGNPLSAQVTFKLFVEPYIQECRGIKKGKPTLYPLRKGVEKKNPLDQFFPVQMSFDNKVEFSPFNGSGDIKATIGSVGIGRHRAEENELKEGALIEVFLW